MKKMFLFATFFTVLSAQNSVDAKFSFKKLKNKVEKAISSSVKQTKESFNKIVDQAKKNFKSDKNNKHEFLNVITPVGDSVVEGADIYDWELDNKLEEVENNLQNIKWGVDQDFILTFQKSNIESKDEVKQLIYNIVLKKYDDSDIALVLFASELKDELDTVNLSLKTLIDFDNKKSKVKDQGKVKTLEETLDNLNFVKNNIEVIIALLNQLLLS